MVSFYNDNKDFLCDFFDEHTENINNLYSTEDYSYIYATEQIQTYNTEVLEGEI